LARLGKEIVAFSNEFKKMGSTYAILGATGNCGSSLIKVLLQSPDTKIHAYCRNKAKLTRLLPDEVQNKRVQVFEGAINDVNLLIDCLRGCRAVFLVASMNDNMPGCRVGQDSAHGVIDALNKIKAENNPSPKLPKIVVLSSATIDEHLSRSMPKWFHPIMIRAGSFVYEDLRVQERILREQQDWLTTIFIKPGGLAVDKSRGHRLDFDKQESFIAYLDLAAAMVEAADDTADRYDMKNVSVCNGPGGGAAFPKGTPWTIVYGLLRHYFPSLHKYLPSSGP
jgi:putative NADH-flavin reductase